MIAQHIFYLVIRSIDNYSWKITNYYPVKWYISTQIQSQLFNSWHWVCMLMLNFLCPPLFLFFYDR